MALQDINLNFPPSPQAQIKRAYQIASAIGLNAAATSAIKTYLPTSSGQESKLGPNARSYLGGIVVSNLSIGGDTYTRGDGTVVRFGDMEFDAVLFQVDRPKNIVYTDIQGKDGSVKEYIGASDYRITINGVIAGDNGRYPDKYNGAQFGSGISTENTVEDLIKASDSNQELTVYSWYLTNLFNINQIVITDFSFWQTEGQYSVQRFKIEARSDAPFIVNLIPNA
jgi:hypothetical protein